MLESHKLEIAQVSLASCLLHLNIVEIKLRQHIRYKGHFGKLAQFLDNLKQALALKK